MYNSNYRERVLTRQKLMLCRAMWCVTGMLVLAFSVDGLSQTSVPSGNLPVQRLGPNDLISVSVLGVPELTRIVRINGEGLIRLPLLTQPILAAGSLPAGLEAAIAAALRRDELVVDPVVSVTVAEYVSRPVTVAGAVRNPNTIQAMGGLRLLDALTRAGGLADDAGAEILVRNRAPDGVENVHRILVRNLMERPGDDFNLALNGGEEIRVPRAPRIFIMGNVRKPGTIALVDSAASSVMKALALAEGLAPFAASQAFIFRTTPPSAEREQIAVNLSKILERKSPDVQLEPDDIFYVPDNKTRRVSSNILDRLVTFGAATTSGVLIWRR